MQGECRCHKPLTGASVPGGAGRAPVTVHMGEAWQPLANTTVVGPPPGKPACCCRLPLCLSQRPPAAQKTLRLSGAARNQTRQSGGGGMQPTMWLVWLTWGLSVYRHTLDGGDSVNRIIHRHRCDSTCICSTARNAERYIADKIGVQPDLP